jgi:vacuolar-type H+-ATPase subunit I/STV1
MQEEIQTSIYAAIAGFVFGGIIKLLNRYLDREKTELELHTTLRKELREELDAVKEELHSLQKELDEWKEKYYHQVELTNELKLAVSALNDELLVYTGAHRTAESISKEETK